MNLQALCGRLSASKYFLKRLSFLNIPVLLFLISAQVSASNPHGVGREQNIHAGFKSKSSSGFIPHTVLFEAMEQNPAVSFKWHFGNDSASADSRVATTRFEYPGTYIVKLIVSNGVQTDSSYMQVDVWPPSNVRSER